MRLDVIAGEHSLVLNERNWPPLSRALSEGGGCHWYCCCCWWCYCCHPCCSHCHCCCCCCCCCCCYQWCWCCCHCHCCCCCCCCWHCCSGSTGVMWHHCWPCSQSSSHDPPHEQWLMRLDVGAESLGIVSDMATWGGRGDVAHTWCCHWCCKVASLIHPMSSGSWVWGWELHRVVPHVVIIVVVSLSRLKLNEKVS